jgi:hypothetical protein
VNVALFESRQSLVHSLVNNILCFIVTTPQQCINISILLWQHVSVLLDHLQASIQRYEVLSVHIVYCGIPFYLQGVHTKYFEIIKIIKLYILKVVKTILARMEIFIHSFIYSFIPLACAECDDSLPFSGASSIPLCYVLFPATLLHQLFFSHLSPHLAIYFLVYLSLLFPNSYIIPFWELYFLPFSVHAQTNIIYLTLLSLL